MLVVHDPIHISRCVGQAERGAAKVIWYIYLHIHWKSKTSKIIVPNFGWWTFPTKKWSNRLVQKPVFFFDGVPKDFHGIKPAMVTCSFNLAHVFPEFMDSHGEVICCKTVVFLATGLWAVFFEPWLVVLYQDIIPTYMGIVKSQYNKDHVMNQSGFNGMSFQGFERCSSWFDRSESRNVLSPDIYWSSDRSQSLFWGCSLYRSEKDQKDFP